MCLIISPSRCSTLFPYTTLFRSGVAAAVPEELPHRAAGVGGDVLERRGFRRGGDDHGRVRHGPRVLEDLDDLGQDRKSTRLNSSHPSISYAVFCLKNKTSTDD